MKDMYIFDKPLKKGTLYIRIIAIQNPNRRPKIMVESARKTVTGKALRIAGNDFITNSKLKFI